MRRIHRLGFLLAAIVGISSMVPSASADHQTALFVGTASLSAPLAYPVTTGDAAFHGTEAPDVLASAVKSGGTTGSTNGPNAYSLLTTALLLAFLIIGCTGVRRVTTTTPAWVTGTRRRTLRSRALALTNTGKPFNVLSLAS